MMQQIVAVEKTDIALEVMAEIEVGLRRFVKYLCSIYFALPEPAASGWAITGYAKKIQGSKLAQKFKTQSEIEKTVA